MNKDTAGQCTSIAQGCYLGVGRNTTILGPLFSLGGLYDHTFGKALSEGKTVFERLRNHCPAKLSRLRNSHACQYTTQALTTLRASRAVGDEKSKITAPFMWWMLSLRAPCDARVSSHVLPYNSNINVRNEVCGLHLPSVLPPCWNNSHE